MIFDELEKQTWYLFLLFGWFIWITARGGGHGFDYQLNAPRTKRHFVHISKKHKKFFNFKNIQQRHEFLKLSVAMQIFANVVFSISILLSFLFLIIGSQMNDHGNAVIVMIYIGLIWIEILIVLPIALYYTFRYREKKPKKK